MATKKKVASKKTQKAAPAKKTVVVTKKVATTKKAAAKPAPAKKAAPPKLAKPAAAKAVAKKAADPKAAASKKAAVAKTPAVTKAAPPAKTITAKKAVEPVKAPAVKKVPVEKQKVVSKSLATTDKVEKSLISKPEEKEVIMPVKKSDKEKETGKKAAAEKTEKAAKVEKVDKAEKVEKTEKPAPAPKVEKTEKPGPNRGTKSATTLVSYQPEFTKSVLDQPDAPTGPVYRYSDADLQEFRELINKKLEAAKKELVYLQGLITRKDEAGTDDTENKYMSMEDGSGSQEREQLNQMASRQIQFIDHLEKALVRIENKTYGICRVTGKLIDKARLRAVPHATLSIEAKLAKSK
jgi:RNA polymerase-binding transcription factor DksA